MDTLKVVTFKNLLGLIHMWKQKFEIKKSAKGKVEYIYYLLTLSLPENITILRIEQHFSTEILFTHEVKFSEFFVYYYTPRGR